jgi:hypothetical protein
VSCSSATINVTREREGPLIRTTARREVYAADARVGAPHEPRVAWVKPARVVGRDPIAMLRENLCTAQGHWTDAEEAAAEASRILGEPAAPARGSSASLTHGLLLL